MRRLLSAKEKGGLLFAAIALFTWALGGHPASASPTVDIRGIYDFNANNFHPSATLRIAWQQGNDFGGFVDGFETQPIHNGTVVGNRAPDTNDAPVAIKFTVKWSDGSFQVYTGGVATPVSWGVHRMFLAGTYTSTNSNGAPGPFPWSALMRSTGVD
jgi:hypothetical protein